MEPILAARLVDKELNVMETGFFFAILPCFWIPHPLYLCVPDHCDSFPINVVLVVYETESSLIHMEIYNLHLSHSKYCIFVNMMQVLR